MELDDLGCAGGEERTDKKDRKSAELEGAGPGMAAKAQRGQSEAAKRLEGQGDEADYGDECSEEGTE